MTRFSRVLTPLQNTYLLVRHGQTDANKQKAYMGRLDHSLNETGLEQAAGIELPIHPDLIFTSPLKRTRETAAILGNKYSISNILVDERLAEKAGGEVEGMPYETIAEKYPDVWGTWETHPLEHNIHSKFPNGESDREVAQRLEHLFFDLEKMHQQKAIVLVTHSGVIQSVRYLLGKTQAEIYSTPVPSCHVEIIGML